MATVDVGDVLPNFGFTVTSNSTGALAAPSIFAVVLTAPDGTTPTVTVTNPSTGIYSVTYVATQAGRYVAVGTATGNGCDGVSTLVWDVSATTAADQPAVGIDLLRQHLAMTQTSTDEDLRLLAIVVTKAIERRTGRSFRRRTVTGEKHDGGRCALLLRRGPVSSVTTVVENGSTLAAGDYVVDEDAGLLLRGSTLTEREWACGRRNISVTYVIGSTTVDEDVLHAHVELARHLFDPRRGGSALPRQAGAGDEWDPRMGFAVPPRVQELIEQLVAPGFA